MVLLPPLNIVNVQYQVLQSPHNSKTLHSLTHILFSFPWTRINFQLIHIEDVKCWFCCLLPSGVRQWNQRYIFQQHDTFSISNPHLSNISHNPIHLSCSFIVNYEWLVLYTLNIFVANLSKYLQNWLTGKLIKFEKNMPIIYLSQQMIA